MDGLPFPCAVRACPRIRRTGARFPPARLAVQYAARGSAAEPTPGSLEHFLVERYRLFAVRESGEIMRTDIHHAPRPLRASHGPHGAGRLSPSRPPVV
jgi:uncharacterized protein YqjF (DUF2071 family)